MFGLTSKQGSNGQATLSPGNAMSLGGQGQGQQGQGQGPERGRERGQVARGGGEEERLYELLDATEPSAVFLIK